MCATPMLNWQSKHAGAITSASLNFAIASSWLLARLAATPASKIFFSSAALPASLAAVVGASTMVISDALPSTTLVSLLTLPIFGSVAVIRYAPDWVSNWTNSPFLSVLVVSFWPEPLSDSIVIATPCSGCCFASITLPLTIVDWASATGANPSNKVINTAVARAVKMCVM